MVDTAKLNAVQPPRANDDMDRLNAYLDVIERGPDAPATLQRVGTDGMRAHVKLAPGQSVVVPETERDWQAWSGGKPVAIRKDTMGLMLLEPPPGEQNLVLEFVTPLENQVGRVVTVLTLGAIWGCSCWATAGRARMGHPHRSRNREGARAPIDRGSTLPDGRGSDLARTRCALRRSAQRSFVGQAGSLRRIVNPPKLGTSSASRFCGLPLCGAA